MKAYRCSHRRGSPGGSNNTQEILIGEEGGFFVQALVRIVAFS